MGSSRARRGALAVLALGWCLVLHDAHAEQSNATTRLAARDLAESGAEAFDKGDFSTALDRFQRAESLYKVPSISVMVARCFARVGRVVEAVDKYEETLRSPLEAGAPEAFQRAVAEAGVEVDAVRMRLARLELHLPADSPAGVQVMLDDKPVRLALLGIPVPLDPGAHHVGARAPGQPPFTADVTLAEGSQQTLEISFQAATGAAAGAGSQPGSAQAGKRVSPLTLGLLAGGGLGLVVGTVSGIAALGHKSSLDAACTPGCAPAKQSEVSAFRFDRTLSYVGFGLGLAAAGAGAYLFFYDGGAGRVVGASVVPGGLAVNGAF